MDDCNIPVNIKVRRNQVDDFCNKLERMKLDFVDLKKADADFEGTSDSEDKIKDLIKQIEQRLGDVEKDKKDHVKFQEGTLEKYKEPDFLKYSSSPKIIEEVREF